MSYTIANNIVRPAQEVQMLYEDLQIATRSKSNTLNSQRKSSVGLTYNNLTRNGSTKLPVLQMILNALGIRNAAENREPMPKDFAALIMLGFMFVLFVISVTGFFVMWFTEYYNNTILQKYLVLTENSEMTNSWLNPDPKFDTLLKVHIFNYTNIEDYLHGRAHKIHIADLGPLIYQEHTVKSNVSFNKNFTVSYRDRKSYKFLPEKSSMGENDYVIVPNVPLLTAAVHVKRFAIFKRWGVTAIINSYTEPLFKKLTVRELLWGYPDKIIKLESLGGKGKTDFGLLMSRNGISVDSVQLHTGEDDIRKFSTVSQFNGMPQLDFWEGDECNRIDGSEPSRFSPNLLQDRLTVNVFLQVLCRKVPLHFEREDTIFNNIDVLRYRMADDAFAHPSENPANQCYCQNTDRCFPSGVINATKCYNDAPIFPSLPHFYAGDPILYKDFEGISPNAELHQTYAEIHPRFGFPIGGASRVQINIMVDKTPLLRNQAARLENATILPLIWIEITSGDISNDMLDTLHSSTFLLNAVQLALKYGTLLVCVTSFSLIVGSVYHINNKREEQEKNKDTAELEALNGSMGQPQPIEVLECIAPAT